MLKLVIAIVVLGLAVAIGGPLIARGSTPAPAVTPAARIEAPITEAAPVDHAPLEEAAPPGPVDDLGSGEEESSPPGPIDDLGSEEELSPPGPVDDLGEVAPVTTTPTRTALSLAPPMDPTPDISASPDAGLPLPRFRTQQQALDGPDTESDRTEGGGAALLSATPFDQPIAPRTGMKDRVAGAR